MNAHARFTGRGAAIALATASLSTFAATAASATTPPGQPIVVTTTADVVDPDDRVTSLREAVTRAAMQGTVATIQLAAGATYTLSCPVAGDEDANAEGDLDLVGNRPGLVVEGRGATVTTASNCTDERLFELRDVAAVTVRDLDLAGGRGRLAGALAVDAATTIVLERVRIDGAVATTGICTAECAVHGAGRLAASGSITLADVVVRDNTARLAGCVTLCHAVGGLWASAPVVHVTGSDVVTNRAVPDSCATRCELVGGLALATPDGRLTASQITGNTADAPTCATCQAVGGLHAGDALVLDHSAIVGNRAAGSQLAAGGASVATAVVTASTISDNRVAGAVALYSAGMLRRRGSTDLRDTTLVDNEGPDGASNLRVLQVEQVTARGTVVGSAAGGSGCALAGSFSSATVSFESGTGCFPPAPGVVTDGGDPRLAPTTPAMPWRAPLAGSPLIDAAGTTCEPTDQAGAARPVGAACDVGAIEYRPPVIPSLPAGASRLVTLNPTRLFDTRPGSEPAGAKGLVGAGETLTVQVAGHAGVPAAATAVVLNVTATEAVAPGYVTAWPAGTPRPEASSLNLTAPGQTRANLVTVGLSATGSVSFFAERGAHLLADVAGYYEGASGARSAGRVVTTTPERLFDTRTGPEPHSLGAGESIRVTVAGRAGVPAHGVAAVVVNLTATEAVVGGYVTVWPAGSPRPNTSALNIDGPGATAANLAVMPLGADGALELSTSGGAHLLADVTAYVTDDTAETATTGLFVPTGPARAFDTRPGTSAPGPKVALPAGGSLSTVVAGAVGVAPAASGVVLNLTATGVADAGFVTAWPTGSARPNASTLNVVAGDTRANAAWLPLGFGGIDLTTSASMHLLADVAGYFLP